MHVLVFQWFLKNDKSMTYYELHYKVDQIVTRMSKKYVYVQPLDWN